MKRARFQAMGLDDDAEHARRPPAPPRRQSPSSPARPPERMAGFFGLPPEIREKIYTLVLDSDRVSPPEAPLLGDHQPTHGDIKYPRSYKSWRWPKGAFWSSHRLRSEFIEAVEARCKKHISKAELDLMVKGYLFFPTWLHLPPDLGAEPFDLDVSLRLFSCEAFKPNDGWPRQPGAGVRTLLTLLNELVHQGPSFGKKFEVYQGKVMWHVDTLRLSISFHDPYTPATWPDAVYQLFRTCKAVATSGLAGGVIRTIHASCTYVRPDTNEGRITCDRSWRVASRPAADDTVKTWRDLGFLTPHQRTLADDPRANWDDSSGGPSRRPQTRISPLERRDSPVGTIAPVGKNPQQDDFGLITPPTPRACMTGAEKTQRRSTPIPPPSSALHDDYSIVMTPRTESLWDDYSSVMTPRDGGGTSDYDGV